MRLKSLIAIMTLSLAMWAQTDAPAPKKNTPGPKAAADCACCKDKAKDHTCVDCCKDAKCEMKDGASCPMMKDSKAACMSDSHSGMHHDGMKHDGKNATMKPDVMSHDKMGAHCSMMAGKDGKKGGCGMCGSTGKTAGK